MARPRKSRPWKAAVGVGLLGICAPAWGCESPSTVQPRTSAEAAPQPIEAPLVPAPVTEVRQISRAPEAHPVVSWLVAGGGATPDSNQVSIEQDLGLAADIFARDQAPGLVLFAAGRRGSVVQVEDLELRGDPLMRELGDLFAPRGGRQAHYRPTKLSPDGPATAEYLLATLDAQLARPGPPLWVYLAGHGDFGTAPAGNALGLWALSTLDVKTLAEHLDRAARPLRLVVTSCYSGGFAELAFAGADPARGPAPGDRCGLFATTWDLEASGCDPNPDRRVQEGFGLHMLHALHGQDRDGTPLPPTAIDFDNDGHISLLEAHARARIASHGIDVPTTTSERWLRAQFSQSPPPQTAPLERHDPHNHPALATVVDLPARSPSHEDGAVIHAFAQEFPELAAPQVARTTLAKLEQTIETTRTELSQSQQQEDLAYRAVAGELLARWPVLDDPWHPDFATTLAGHKRAISHALEQSTAYATYLAAREQSVGLGTQVGELRGRAARLERYTRALDNTQLAAKLQTQGGAPWRVYQQLLACERTTVAKLGP